MIEVFKYLMSREDLSLGVGQITEVDNPQNNGWLVKVNVFPEEYEVVGLMLWPKSSQEPPEISDVVCLLMPQDNTETVLCFGAIRNANKPVHARTIGGECVLGAIQGKKTNVVSDTRVNIGRGGETEESEPLVLGDVLKSMFGDLFTRLTTICDNLSTASENLQKVADDFNANKSNIGSNSGGNVALNPVLETMFSEVSSAAASVKSAVDTLKDTTLPDDKSKYVDTASTNIVSQIGFTERGTE